MGQYLEEAVAYFDNKGNKTTPARAASVRVEQNGVVVFSNSAYQFGGPGSGRHAEGGQKTDDKETEGAKTQHLEATKDTGWKHGSTDSIKGPTGQENRSQ